MSSNSMSLLVALSAEREILMDRGRRKLVCSTCDSTARRCCRAIHRVLVIVLISIAWATGAVGEALAQCDEFFSSCPPLDPPPPPPPVVPPPTVGVATGLELARNFANRSIDPNAATVGSGLGRHAPPPPPTTAGIDSGRTYGRETVPGSNLTINQVPKAQGVVALPHVNPTEAPRSDPVEAFNGEFVYRKTLMSFPGFGVPFRFEVTYRSRVAYEGPVGFGWDHSLNQRLLKIDNGWLLSSGNLTTIAFKSDASGNLVSQRGTLLRLTQAAGQWVLTDRSGIVRTFDTRGHLISIKDGYGQGLAVSWAAGPGDRLESVTDSAGRLISFTYEGDKLVRVQHAPSGSTASLTYVGRALASVTNTEGQTE